MKKIILFAFLAFLAVTSVNAQLRIKMGKNSPIEKLGRAEIAITNLYVDSVDENKLVEDAIRGMLEKLDPHSSYATAKETKAMNEPLNGSFDGIGVQFNMVDDTLLVIQPVVNGPSEKVGIILTLDRTNEFKGIVSIIVYYIQEYWPLFITFCGVSLLATPQKTKKK